MNRYRIPIEFQQIEMEDLEQIPPVIDFRASRYPWAEMDHGQAFFIEAPGNDYTLAKRMRIAAHRSGYRFCEKKRPGWIVKVSVEKKSKTDPRIGIRAIMIQTRHKRRPDR